MSRRASWVWVAALLWACGTRTSPKVERYAVPPRVDSGAAGMDAGPTGRDGGPDAETDAGTDAGPARPCAEGCDDGRFCDGVESCDEASGLCVRSPAPDCNDGVECTVDTCDEITNACVHVSVDRDEDGDGVSACAGDCDDHDARAFPGNVEACDGRDNNCNGTVDEGLIFECGDCRPGCHRTQRPRTGEQWMPTPEDSSGVQVAPDGSLTLSSTRTETHFAWIANTELGTITKLDTRTGLQVAEYDSVLLDGTNHAAMPGTECRTSVAGGNCPSRTAVDLRGNMFVANRAFFVQGTVTKIANFTEDCIDRNRDGVIQTSQDLDGDGVIEPSVPGELVGQSDECILWTVDVGADGGVPRAIAVAGDGSVWVGLNNSQQIIQLDPSDGHELRSIGRLRLHGMHPYGAAIDRRGTLWFTDAGSGRIASVDTTTGTVGPAETAPTMPDCPSAYGIAIDAHDRVWIAGFLCPVALRYDPSIGDWFSVSLPDSGVTRGIAVDAAGTVYLASSHEWIHFGPGGITEASDPIARLTMFDGEDGSDLRTLDVPGRGSIGVGLDSAGFVWMVNQDSATATRVDPRTGDAREYPVGLSPYTYSDFTGYALRTFTAPNGYVRMVVDGCPFGPTEWERLDWDATIPAGAHVEIRVRSASRREDLAMTSWIGPWRATPAELASAPGPVPANRYLEVEILLVSEDEVNTPALRTVTVQYNCP